MHIQNLEMQGNSKVEILKVLPTDRLHFRVHKVGFGKGQLRKVRYIYCKGNKNFSFVDVTSLMYLENNYRTIKDQGQV